MKTPVSWRTLLIFVVVISGACFGVGAALGRSDSSRSHFRLPQAHVARSVVRVHARRLQARPVHARRLQARPVHARPARARRLHARRERARRLHARRERARRLHARRERARRLHARRERAAAARLDTARIHLATSGHHRAANSQRPASHETSSKTNSTTSGQTPSGGARGSGGGQNGSGTGSGQGGSGTGNGRTCAGGCRKPNNATGGVLPNTFSLNNPVTTSGSTPGAAIAGFTDALTGTQRQSTPDAVDSHALAAGPTAGAAGGAVVVRPLSSVDSSRPSTVSRQNLDSSLNPTGVSLTAHKTAGRGQTKAAAPASRLPVTPAASVPASVRQPAPDVIERFVGVVPQELWIALGGALLLAAAGVGVALRSGWLARRRAGQFAAVSAAALTDPLTGVLNRRGFLDAAERELARARRYGRPFALAYADVRGLKAVNDTEGHLAGDKLLQQAAGLLAASARADDLVGRIGGDELALLLPEQSADGATSLTNRIRDELPARRQSSGIEARWDLTVGTAVYPEDGESIEQLLEVADRRLYEQRGISLR
jgi:diguanylate cyclase (GGDEF)-like protein